MANGFNDAFIGRDKEITRFQEILKDKSETQKKIVFIFDEVQVEGKWGGIGKTWLLKQFISIANEKKFNNDYIIIDSIFDFFEPIIQDRLSRHIRVVQALEKKYPTQIFLPFWDKVKDYYNRPLSLEAILDNYYDCYNAYCNVTHKQVIRFYDTFERNESALNHVKGKYRFINDKILENSLVVISGRIKPDYEKAIWAGRQNIIEEMPLSGFTTTEAKKFFVKFGIRDIKEAEIETINKKAEGRPILLALAADFINNRMKTLEELIRSCDKNVTAEDFKRELVQFVSNFENPTDHAILAMAHLKHRCDKDVLKRYLVKEAPQSFQESNYDDFLQQLSNLSFVRTITRHDPNVVLHDEMQLMVSEYVFPVVDSPDHKLRQDLSKIVLPYYKEQIEFRKKQILKYEKQNEISKAQELQDEILALIAEQWYHLLFLDHSTKKFEEFFFEVFDPNLEDGKLDFCNLLISYLSDLEKLINFDIEIKNRIKLRQSKVYADMHVTTGSEYYFRKALAILVELEKDASKPGQPQKYKAAILLERGVLYYNKGDNNEAQKSLKKSLALLNKEDNQDLNWAYFVGRAKTWYGYILYQLGFFRKAIKNEKEAIVNLEFATQLLQETGIDALQKFRQNQILGWEATARGNLGRILRETGDLSAAYNYAQEALVLTEALKRPTEMIRARNTLGLIFQRMSRFDDAQEQFNEAEKLLKSYPNIILESRIKTNRASLLIKRDQISEILEKYNRTQVESKIRGLNIGDDDFATAEKLLVEVIDKLQMRSCRELSTAHYNLGELYLFRKNWQKCEDQFLKAKKVAENRHDSYTLMNVLQRMILLQYLKKC